MRALGRRRRGPRRARSRCRGPCGNRDKANRTVPRCRSSPARDPSSQISSSAAGLPPRLRRRLIRCASPLEPNAGRSAGFASRSTDRTRAVGSPPPPQFEPEHGVDTGHVGRGAHVVAGTLDATEQALALQFAEGLAQRADRNSETCRHVALGRQLLALDDPPGRNLADQHFADLLMHRKRIGVSGRGHLVSSEKLIHY